MANIVLKRQIAAREQLMGEVEGRFSLRRLYHNWKIRRQITRLQDRSDRVLDDIGVTRDELSWASQLPLTVNASLALEDRAYRRRKAQRQMYL